MFNNYLYITTVIKQGLFYKTIFQAILSSKMLSLLNLSVLKNCLTDDSCWPDRR